MADNDFRLATTKRSKVGTTEARRLRRQGQVPGNVYGHGQESIAVAAPADVVARIVHSGHKVVDLEIDGQADTAIFREVQWDTFGVGILHFDLVRVSKEELVEVTVPIELHGVSPGVLAGGMLEQPLHEIEIECPAVSIPDKIEVNVNELQIGSVIHVGDLKLPENVRVVTPADLVLLQVVLPMAAPAAEEEAAAGPVEPEVIGRKKEEEAGE